jgi:hypothetical protein
MAGEAIQKNRQIVFGTLLFRRFDRKTKWSWGLILSLLLFTYLLLQLIPFPQYQQVSEVQVSEEIFEIFEPPPPVSMPGTADKDAVLSSADKVESIDEITDFLPFETFETLDIGGEIIQEMDFFEDVGGGIEELVREMDVAFEGTGTLGDELFLTGDGEPSVLDEGLKGLKPTGDRPGLEEAEGTGLPSLGQGGGRGGGIGKGTGSGKSLSLGTGVTVKLKSFGEDDYHGKEIVNPLIEWIRKNPRIHEYTVRSFLENKSNDLTSIAFFSVGERYLEMYLQVTEETKELAIFIVEGNRFTKLIDQGITQRSHVLEIGRVERDSEDGRIVNIFATQTSPTKERTDDFMSLFLSWWNNGNPIE